MTARIEPTPEDAAIFDRHIGRLLRHFDGKPLDDQAHLRMIKVVTGALKDTIEAPTLTHADIDASLMVALMQDDGEPNF